MTYKKYLLISSSLSLSIIPIVSSVSCSNTNSSYESKIFRVVQYEPLLNIDVKNFIGNTYAFSLTINVGTASTNVNSGNYYYRGTYIDYITNANGDIFQYNPNATNANDWYSRTLNLYAYSPFLEFTITLNKNEVRPW